MTDFRNRLADVLHEGAPMWVLSLVAIVALAGVLFTAARTPEPVVRGYAEFRAVDEGCSLMPARSLNALRCTYKSPSVYEVVFTRDISRSAPVATRSTCCPGPVAVSISGRRSVTVTFAGQRAYPIVAQVVVP